MIEKNKTWILVDNPIGQYVIEVKWIYKTKLNVDGSVNKYKSRLVIKVYGFDYNETFAPVARHDAIRSLTTLATKERRKLWHLEVKSAFLNGYLTEDIFIQQLEGFMVPGTENKNQSGELVGYYNSDWARSLDDSKMKNTCRVFEMLLESLARRMGTFRYFRLVVPLELVFYVTHYHEVRLHATIK
ncbi:Reverse transcriptase [Theobroma cacao]|nr:Reverse transcriptase [Theobroma cacao]